MRAHVTNRISSLQDYEDMLHIFDATARCHVNESIVVNVSTGSKMTVELFRVCVDKLGSYPMSMRFLPLAVGFADELTANLTPNDRADVLKNL